jgi:nucleoporin NDC1
MCILCGIMTNFTKAFAFWELAYIAQRFQGRRKVIFEDIDRNGGSMWSQILTVCLEAINGIEKRITEHQNPTVASVVDPSAVKRDEIKQLPRLTQPLKDGLKESGDLFSSPTPGAVEVVGKFAKSRGQSSNNTLSPKAKRLLSQAEGALLTPEQRQAVSSEGFVGLFREWITWFLQNPAGRPFRQEYRRKVAAVVLGEPFGDVGIIVDAIDSLTRLAVYSLTEDKYGNVQRDVKRIIRTLTTTVTELEGFKNSVGFHWTDVGQKKESPEVDTILAALKGGLNELVTAFGDYSEDLRLSQSEMRMAREAAAIPAKPERTEMEQRGR